MEDQHGTRGRTVLFLALSALILLGGTIGPASAHGQRSAPSGPTTGLSIPNLTHGQMAVIADNQAAIMDLASKQFPTDPVMRRLEGFIDIQAFTCGWGLVPGSVTDENSPFNECSHAYLAATQALLLHLRTMRGDRASVGILVRKIENEMIEHGASLVLCRYSDEPFNTADFIYPHLGAIPIDPIGVGRILIVSTLSGWLVVVLVRRTMRRPGERIGSKIELSEA